MNRPIDRVFFVKELSNFVRSYNKEIGMSHGLPEEEINKIMDSQTKSNQELAAQIYDFLRLEGYIDG